MRFKHVTNIVSSNVHKSCDLTFRLYARRYLHADKFMGAVSQRVDELVTHPHRSTSFFLFSMSPQLSISSSGLHGMEWR